MRLSRTSNRAAFTLMEAVILLVIFSIVALATATSLSALTRSPRDNDVQLAIDNVMVDKMEQLKAIPFDSLATGNTYSDTVAINGVSYARTVTVAAATANPPAPPAGPTPKAPKDKKGDPPAPPPPPKAPAPKKGAAPPAPPAPPPLDYKQVTVTVNGKTWVTYLCRP